MNKHWQAIKALSHLKDIDSVDSVKTKYFELQTITQERLDTAIFSPEKVKLERELEQIQMVLNCCLYQVEEILANNK